MPFVPDEAPAAAPQPGTVRVFVAAGTRGPDLTIFRVRCRSGDDLCTIHETLADGTLFDWPGPVRGVHQAEAAVRARGAG